MLDIGLFRRDLAGVAAGLAKRGLALDTAAFEALERERKDIQVRTQEAPKTPQRAVEGDRLGEVEGRQYLRAARRSGRRRRRRAQDARVEARPRAVEAARLPAGAAPNGARVRPVKPVPPTTTSRCAATSAPRAFDFAVKDHTDLGEGNSRTLDFATAAKLSRTALLVHARRSRAPCCRWLAQFMLDVQTPSASATTSSATRRTSTAETLVGTTQLPKFEGRHVLGQGRAGRKARASRST